jgi:hypothetical protein
MDWAGEETGFVLGRTRGSSGDPSPVTARGVWLGIRAAVRLRGPNAQPSHRQTRKRSDRASQTNKWRTHSRDDL